MVFSFNIYSALLLGLVVHLLVYAFLLFRHSREHQQRAGYWLAGYLLLSTLYIMPWMLGFAGWYDAQPYRNLLFYFPCNLGMALGPVVLVYLEALLYPHQPPGRKQYLHFLPLMGWLLFHAVAAITDLLLLPEPWFAREGTDFDFISPAQEFIMLSQLMYMGIALKRYRTYRTFIVEEYSFADSITYRWVERFLWCFAGVQVISLLFLITGHFTDLDYIGEWWKFFVLGLVSYYLAITGYAHQVAQALSRASFVQAAGAEIQEAKSARTELLLQESRATEKAALPGGQEILLQAEKCRLLNYMEAERPYRNPELSLLMMAEALGWSRNVLSRVINEGLGKNFNDFVNQYRVNEVEKSIQDPANSHLTFMSLAYDAGFNSKATFNRAFKKFTGRNPGEKSGLTD